MLAPGGWVGGGASSALSSTVNSEAGKDALRIPLWDAADLLKRQATHFEGVGEGDEGLSDETAQMHRKTFLRICMLKFHPTMKSVKSGIIHICKLVVFGIYLPLSSLPAMQIQSMG